MRPDGRPSNLREEAQALVKKMLASAQPLDRVDGIIVDTLLQDYEAALTDLKHLEEVLGGIDRLLDALPEGRQRSDLRLFVRAALNYAKGQVPDGPNEGRNTLP